MKGGVRQVVQLQRRDGGLRARRQDAVDGEQRRRRPLGQRAAQQQRRAQQRRRLARPARARAARPAHAVRRQRRASLTSPPPPDRLPHRTHIHTTSHDRPTEHNPKRYKTSQRH